MNRSQHVWGFRDATGRFVPCGHGTPPVRSLRTHLTCDKHDDWPEVFHRDGVAPKLSTASQGNR